LPCALTFNLAVVDEADVDELRALAARIEARLPRAA
jgi:hypothetical protein